MPTVLAWLLFMFKKCLLEPSKVSKPGQRWLRTPKRRFENSNGSRKYERGKMLGEGAYGRVYACRELPGRDELPADNEFVAVKIVCAREFTAQGRSQRVLEKLREEARTMERVSGHANILHFHESFSDDDDWIYFVTELLLDAHTHKSMSLYACMDIGRYVFSCRKYYGGLVLFLLLIWAFTSFRLDCIVLGSVIAAMLIGGMLTEPIRNMLTEPIRNYINASFDCPQRITEDKARTIVRQIISGVKHLHAANIIHRDLKLENVILLDNLNVKIIDFGLSKELGEGLSMATTQVGSSNYISPEISRGDGHDYRTDLWSLGILIFFMLTARRWPLTTPKMADQRDIDAIVSSSTEISKDAGDFLLGLLRIQPAERTPLDELSTLAWLEEGPTP